MLEGEGEGWAEPCEACQTGDTGRVEAAKLVT